jgi:hypothetical protein
MDSSIHNNHHNNHVNWPLGLSPKDNMKKPLMTIGLREITNEDYNHFFHKWLYQYGGAGDVVSLQEFVDTYDSDIYGEIDKYDTGLCPCVMCIEETINEQKSITKEVL